MKDLITLEELKYRLFINCNQGGRKYMEDTYCVAYQHNNGAELEYIYMGIFDGHGGREASLYTRDHLLNNITSNKLFWSMNDDDVLRAIKEGFVQTHLGMIKEVAKWPKTGSGLESTSGTTASVIFIMNDKYYTGHVGDSKIVLGRKNNETGMWIPFSLTRDHKPDCPIERQRITEAGGQVMNKSGVDRVVWNRPKFGHKGPVRRSTNFDQIPFLAVARSLGDLWSYNSALDTYVVSPEPDVDCIPINASTDKCIILASDGLWNMLITHEAIRMLQEIEENIDSVVLNSVFAPSLTKPTNPARALVQFAIQRWLSSRLRADNTSVIAVLLDTYQSSKPPKLTSLYNMTYESHRPLEESELQGKQIEERMSNLIEAVVLSATEYECEYVIDPETPPKPKPMYSWLYYNDFNYDEPYAFPLYYQLYPKDEDENRANDNSFPSIETAEAHKIHKNEINFLAIDNKSSQEQGSDNTFNKSEEQPKIINGVEVIKDFKDDGELSSNVEANRIIQVGDVVKVLKDESVTAINEMTRSNQFVKLKGVWSAAQSGSDANLVDTPTLRTRDSPNGTLFNRQGFFRISRKRRWASFGKPHLSPPFKHLRSENWSRTIPLSAHRFNRGWRALAASLLTKSRLRARVSKTQTI